MNATLATEPLVYTRNSEHDPNDLLTHTHLWPEGLQEITFPTGVSGSVFYASYTWDQRRISVHNVIHRSVFTGSPVPAKVHDLHTTRPDDSEEIRVLAKAYEIALKKALKARFRADLKAARPAFDHYATTLAALERTWEALQCTRTDVWNAAVLTLQQAQDAHQSAAEELDDRARQALRDAGHRSGRGLQFDDLNDLVNEQGDDFSAVVSASEDDYRPNPYSREDLSGVAVDKARKLIARQRAQLIRASEMMPTTTQKGH